MKSFKYKLRGNSSLHFRMFNVFPFHALGDMLESQRLEKLLYYRAFFVVK